jgi:hypothetical protein
MVHAREQQIIAGPVLKYIYIFAGPGRSIFHKNIEFTM